MPRQFTAEVKEGADGHPSIIIQPNVDNGLTDDKRIRIDFAEGTSVNAVQSIANSLNMQAENVSVVNW